MTKDEYIDFVLRYKGCGACFPMYHSLSRFEKMWFTAIQKDVTELEKENAELEKVCDETQELLDKQIEATYKLDKENAELKSEKGCETCTKFDEAQLTKATELLKRCYANYIYLEPLRSEIKQFLKDLEK